MRNNIINSLAFGLCIFLSLCALLSTNTVLSVQSYSSRIRATFSPATHSEPFKRDLIQINPVGPKLLKRARRWTPDETELLLELRERQLSWEEIHKSFPERTWVAVALKHAALKRDSSTKKKKTKPWTNDEHELLLELVKTNTPWIELAEQFPGRTIASVKSQYNYLTRGVRLLKSYKAKWTPAEDELLIELEKKDVPWEERETFFGNRSLTALQYRLKSLLPNQTLLGNFTPEEDEK